MNERFQSRAVVSRTLEFPDTFPPEVTPVALAINLDSQPVSVNPTTAPRDRSDLHTRLVVDQALVLKKLRGYRTAAEYLAKNLVDEDIALRVLLGPSTSRRHDDVR